MSAKLAHYEEKEMSWYINKSIDKPENKINDFTEQRIVELLKKQRNLKMEIERTKKYKNKDKTKINKMTGEYLKYTCDIILLKESMRWIGM